MNASGWSSDAPSVATSLELFKRHKELDIEINERLVQIRQRSRIVVRAQYALNGLKNSETVLRMRKSVHTRLKLAANMLPPATTLIVLDAWRSAALQQELYDYFNAKRLPSVDPENYVFNPLKVGSIKSYPTDAPPHRTGGAVDVVLGDLNGEPLAMGAGYDEMTALARTTAFEGSDNGLPSIQAQAFRLRRRILVHVMSKAGFSNYSEEFWHYDFGNSFWRFYSGICGIGKFGVIE